MKQILQHLKNGAAEVADVPCPRAGAGRVLIRSRVSLVSAGTERMLVEFGKANLIDKARQQPDKVRMVLDKIRTDGLLPTIEAVRNKLDQPVAMGYCNVGEVLEVGAGVSGFAPGDRVASNGQHAEVVVVPANLCAKVPARVEDEAAVFTVVSAIALQGIRLAQPTLGECVAVVGMGLIGLVTAQLLRANGCRVLGIDFDAAKLALAREFGADTVDLSRGEDPVVAGLGAFSRGRGVDAVIITASTQSNEPVRQAAQMCRKRGRIVLVGVTGLELSRADFYEKELSFQVSCSYGPGRYDAEYEEKGHDYPVGFVRWTEQRNFEAVLDMMAAGRVDVRPLVTHRFPIGQAEQAYALLGGGEPSLGILLTYPTASERPESELRRATAQLSAAVGKALSGVPVLGLIGAGNYATAVLIPAFKATGARLKTVVSAQGVSSLHAARKFGIEAATTDANAVLGDPDVNAVVITTRHDSHARFVLMALERGKHVFVEKPLCLTLAELEAIEQAHRAKPEAGQAPVVMVGLNRRFSPQVQRIKDLLGGVSGPKSFVMTVNAGAIPPAHWTQDPAVGGGRIVGEACHFIDLLRFLAGCSITDCRQSAMSAATGDTVTLQLGFVDGSIGTVHYLSNGSKAFPKERLEVFCAGRVLQLDNFRQLRGYGWPGFRKMNLWRQDKGQRECAAAFVRAVQAGGPAPISFDELIEVSRVSILAQQAAN